jgi:hypothetical protein
MNDDREHLRLLAIFHYVVGALIALCACIPIIHLLIGIGVVSGAIDFDHRRPGGPDVQVFGWIFIAVAAVFILAGWSLAIAIFIAGRLLQRRRGYLYCLVVAAIECMFTPFGTVLGVFTIVVLIRPSVKELFTQPPASVTISYDAHP